MALDEVTAARYVPVLQGQVRRLQTHIEDLEHELRLARQHLDVCPTAVAIAEEDAAKRRAG